MRTLHLENHPITEILTQNNDVHDIRETHEPIPKGIDLSVDIGRDARLSGERNAKPTIASSSTTSSATPRRHRGHRRHYVTQKGVQAQAFHWLLITDARFEYEYAGGHIARAINVTSVAGMKRLFD
jgi:hypothetical protein